MTRAAGRRIISNIAIAGLSVLVGGKSFDGAPPQKAYELSGGWWFDGTTFGRKTMYAVAGILTDVRPARVDSVIQLGESYVVPPFGDAHNHSFGSAQTVGPVVRSYLSDGVFYAMSLTNSIRDQRSAVDSVNKPQSVDVAYANAGLTATLGHPILSAEMTANHISWDSLAFYAARLRHSHTAEGDVYFVIDSLADLRRKWSRILASRPDVIKIFLMDVEHFEQLRSDTLTIDNKGLDPALVPAQRRSLARLAAHGVPVAIGPDLFGSAFAEASYLEKLGVYSRSEILRMWSTVTPRLIFPRRRIGRLASGYEASLLALECDPIADFQCVRRIRLRIKQGWPI